MAIANTITYETLFEDVLQDRLDHPTTYKEMCDVTITDTRVISTSYLSTTPSVQTVTRGTGHSMQTFAETAETLTISTGRDLGLFVDWADLAQSPWTKPAELFDRIGALLNEFIESNVLAQHAKMPLGVDKPPLIDLEARQGNRAEGESRRERLNEGDPNGVCDSLNSVIERKSERETRSGFPRHKASNKMQWTDFGTASIGGGGADTDQITVSATNIDDIIRGVKRRIRVANGQMFMNSNGVGFVWRPADFELLEAFTQANGFQVADKALVEGTVEGLHYLGCDHFWSNEHTANHLFAGVKKIQRLGILRGTFGRAHTIDFPAGDSNTYLSGRSFYSRVDIGHLTPTEHTALVFDINVA